MELTKEQIAQWMHSNNVSLIGITSSKQVMCVEDSTKLVDAVYKVATGDAVIMNKLYECTPPAL